MDESNPQQAPEAVESMPQPNDTKAVEATPLHEATAIPLEPTAEDLKLNAQVEEWEAEASGDQEEEPTAFSWQASEFIHHQKSNVWYMLLGLAVIVIVAVAVVTHQWFSAAVFIAMAVALFVYAAKEPRVLSYQLDSHGITIEHKLYRYDQFRSFAVFNDVAWHSIDFDPMQRFSPRLTVIFESKDLETICDILSAQLPRIDRTPDFVERISRRVKF